MLVEIVLFAVLITETELPLLLSTYALAPSGLKATPKGVVPTFIVLVKLWACVGVQMTTQMKNRNQIIGKAFRGTRSVFLSWITQ